MLAALLAVGAGIAGFHWSWRGAGTSWKFYDPTFLYALSGSTQDAPGGRCDEPPIVAFGSSVLLAAFSPLPARPPGRFTLTSAVLDSGQPLRIFTRYGATDLRFFRPLMESLPPCPRTIVLHSDVFVLRGFKRPKWRDFYDTLAYRLSSRLEGLWPEALQRKTRAEHIRPLECDEGCFARRREGMAKRYGVFHGLNREHLEIVHELVDRGDRIVILDLGRSERLEEEFREGLHHFRAAVQELADGRPEIDYLEFGPQRNEFYADYTHLNESGRRVFESWLAQTPALRAEFP